MTRIKHRLSKSTKSDVVVSIDGTARPRVEAERAVRTFASIVGAPGAQGSLYTSGFRQALGLGPDPVLEAKRRAQAEALGTRKSKAVLEVRHRDEAQDKRKVKVAHKVTSF